MDNKKKEGRREVKEQRMGEKNGRWREGRRDEQKYRRRK